MGRNAKQVYLQWWSCSTNHKKFIDYLNTNSRWGRAGFTVESMLCRNRNEVMRSVIPAPYWKHGCAVKLSKVWEATKSA